jgi:ADP-ribose pyrophosphatase YjhB (NUDIX family)
VKALIVRDGKILLMKECEKRSGKWELPGGGLDFGEDVHTALAREVMEEMGVRVTMMAESPLYVWTWRYEQKRGMEWYYALVLAYPVEVDSLEFAPTNECEEEAFFTQEELADMPLSYQTNGLKDFFDVQDFVV